MIISNRNNKLTKLSPTYQLKIMDMVFIRICNFNESTVHRFSKFSNLSKYLFILTISIIFRTKSQGYKYLYECETKHLEFLLDTSLL